MYSFLEQDNLTLSFVLARQTIVVFRMTQDLVFFFFTEAAICYTKFLQVHLTSPPYFDLVDAFVFKDY